MRISFDVDGEPMGKGRPRWGKGRTYTPEKTVRYENNIAAVYFARAKHYRFPPDMPLAVRITAYFPIPKSRSKAAKTQMAAGEIKPTKRPDADNIGKIVLDALNGRAWHDDAQVTSCSVAKRYGQIPHVVVEIEEDKGNDCDSLP